MNTRAPSYRYLDTSGVAAERTVVFAPSMSLTSGSTRKAAQAIRLVKSIFRQRLGCIVKPHPCGIVIECPEAAEADILQLCGLVEQKLKSLQQQPLTAKMVEEILSITSAERRRWSKDSRLPNAGQAFFSQGKKRIGLFVYSPHVIRELVDRLERIAEWRRADDMSAAASFHKESSMAH